MSVFRTCRKMNEYGKRYLQVHTLTSASLKERILYSNDVITCWRNEARKYIRIFLLEKDVKRWQAYKKPVRPKTNKGNQLSVQKVGVGIMSNNQGIFIGYIYSFLYQSKLINGFDSFHKLIIYPAWTFSYFIHSFVVLCSVC